MRQLSQRDCTGGGGQLVDESGTVLEAHRQATDDLQTELGGRLQSLNIYRQKKLKQTGLYSAENVERGATNPTSAVSVDGAFLGKPENRLVQLMP